MPRNARPESFFKRFFFIYTKFKSEEIKRISEFYKSNMNLRNFLKKDLIYFAHKAGCGSSFDRYAFIINKMANL